jgi:hypothetical protein
MAGFCVEAAPKFRRNEGGPGAPTFARPAILASYGWQTMSAPKFVVIRSNEGGPGAPTFASLAKA